MTDEDITGFNERITEKLGKENAATIADDIGILITKHEEDKRTREAHEKRIHELESMNEKLAKANANLIHQIPRDTEPESKQEQKTITFNLRDAFDEKGRFVR